MLDDRIRRVMGEVFGVDPTEIDHDSSPGSVEQWDSIRHMNLVLALEEEFSIRFADDQVDQLINFRLIEITLRELLPGEDS
jgi:acyl carrier protein